MTPACGPRSNKSRAKSRERRPATRSQSFGMGATRKRATPAAARDPAFSDLSDDSDDDSDDDPFGDAPAQRRPVGGAQNSQQDMDMGETLSFGDTSDGDDSASDDPFGSNKSGGDDPFADPFEDPNSP